MILILTSFYARFLIIEQTVSSPLTTGYSSPKSATSVPKGIKLH